MKGLMFAPHTKDNSGFHSACKVDTATNCLLFNLTGCNVCSLSLAWL